MDNEDLSDSLDERNLGKYIQYLPLAHDECLVMNWSVERQKTCHQGLKVEN